MLILRAVFVIILSITTTWYGPTPSPSMSSFQDQDSLYLSNFLSYQVESNDIFETEEQGNGNNG